MAVFGKFGKFGPPQHVVILKNPLREFATASDDAPKTKNCATPLPGVRGIRQTTNKQNTAQIHAVINRLDATRRDQSEGSKMPVLAVNKI